MQWKSEAPVSLYLRELAEEKELNQESEATIKKMIMEWQTKEDSNKTQVSKSSSCYRRYVQPPWPVTTQNRNITYL